ncbi:MAG: PilX N-terminal domain-containing pilus assembly protein [Myxococcota bacterium]
MTATNRHEREAGAALLVAMLMLVLMGMIGFASLETVMRDRQVAGYSNQAQSALYAADAGIADSLDMLRVEITGSALTSGDCLTTNLEDKTLSSRTLPNGAYYEPNPDAPNSGKICMLAAATPCAEVDASIEQGGPIYLYTVWNTHAQGVSPGGANTRVYATSERCHAFNN